ncbi:probable ascorbate-specific transmembrane electron transporter 2 [Andrographis paniculata]|uniref:probable ascorbate-specific transmembrane electron transporter 2 n=1 Tax=Andrographis paniculata TaxID=175694 RepID=UPI0021E88906|nr:probable ascorbate-specific transmembrane electron transporter 2 [Andrographis paniculata]
MAAKRISIHPRWVLPITIFAHLLALAVFILVLVWLLHFREGLSFDSDNKGKIFNLHPFFMLLGFILFSGEAIMAYRTVRGVRRTQKLLHLILHLIALVAGIIGIYAVFKFHDEIESPNMYTLHSWIGLSTFILFGLQWLFAFFSFWYPKARTAIRARFLPWHAVLGLVIFLMAIVTAETGLVERFHFLGLVRSQEALIVNFIGLLVLLFAIAVAVGVALPKTTY